MTTPLIALFIDVVIAALVVSLAEADAMTLQTPGTMKPPDTERQGRASRAEILPGDLVNCSSCGASRIHGRMCGTCGYWTDDELMNHLRARLHASYDSSVKVEGLPGQAEQDATPHDGEVPNPATA